MDGLLTLIAQSYQQNDLGEQISTETTVEVLAHIQSVTRAEWFSGGKNGLQPSLVAITPRVNYSGQKIAAWDGQRYAVYRTYFPEDSDEIELYLEERVGV